MKLFTLKCADQQDVIKMGMTDAKLVLNIFFFVNVKNPLPDIQNARVRFLKIWIKKYQIGRQPQINLFFEVPENEWLYVHENWCGECKRAKMLLLDCESMSQPEKIINSFLKTHKVYREMWEAWREKKIKMMDDYFLAKKNQIPELKMI